MPAELPTPQHSAGATRLWQLAGRELFTRSSARFPALDGVRAIAALLIVLFHSAVVMQQTGGAAVAAVPVTLVRWLFTRLWIGVDIFFVLSGFLIGRILTGELQHGRIDFRGFYIRRVARIFPAYYVVLTVALVVFLRTPLPRSDLLYAAAANYLYISNYYPGYTHPNFMGWAWSLCVEEHFYLVFPALLTLIFRCCGPRGRVAVLAGLPLLPLVARAVVFIRNPNILLWNDLHWQTHTHCDGLLLGVLIAYLFVFHQAVFARVTARLAPLLLLVAVLCFASVLWWGGTMRPGFFAVVLQLFVVAAGTGLVIANCLFVGNLLSRCLAHRFWYPIARVSYGMYLIHYFVCMWLLGRWPDLTLALAHSRFALVPFAALVASISFAGASVLFLGVELPLLRAGARLSRASAPLGDRRAPQAAVNGRAA